MTLLPIPIYVFLSELSIAIAIFFSYVQKSDEPHANLFAKNFHAFSLNFLIDTDAFISLVSWKFILCKTFKIIKIAKIKSFYKLIINFFKEITMSRRNRNRFFSILVTLALVIVTNIAISYGASTKATVPILPDSPRPRATVPILPDSPRPRATVPILPDSPRPR